MKWNKVIAAVLFLGVCWALHSAAYAQKTAQMFTIIYSNNICAEIDPCPT